MDFPIQFNEILIRPEKKGDAEKLKEFKNKLISEKAMIGTKEKKSLEKWREIVKYATKKMELNLAVVLIAEKRNQIVGLAAIFMENQKMEYFGDLGIILDKSVREIGLGSKLMELIIVWGKNKLPKLQAIELGVFSLNKSALMLYTKFNFKKVAILPKKIKHFGNFCDEIIMHRWL